MYISFLGIASKYDYVQKHRGSNGYLTVNLIIRVVRLLFRVVVTSVQTNADTRGAENAQQILKKDLCRSVQLQQRKREESSSGLCQRIIHISTDQIIRTNFVSVCIKYPCMPSPIRKLHLFNSYHDKQGRICRVHRQYRCKVHLSVSDV